MTDDAAATEAGSSHRHEPHTGSLSARLNWLRAGVLGANDGIVSTGALVVGVAAATTSSSAIATAGVAGLAAGAVSMALGEYVSVSTQRDTEKASVARERGELERMPKAELRELIGLLQQRGLSPPTAQTVAEELTEHDALAAHLALELGINREELANPWAAAGVSAVSFTRRSTDPTPRHHHAAGIGEDRRGVCRRALRPRAHRRTQRPTRRITQAASDTPTRRQAEPSP